MPLRDLPTEQDAAAALLRAERLRRRAAERQRLAIGIALLAVTAVVVLLLPGLASGGRCALWRPGVDSLFGRRAGLVLPAVILVLVMAAQAVSAKTWAMRLRRWAAVVCVGYGLVVPLALSQQSDDRDDCGWTGTAWASLVIGVALAAAAIRWARSPASEPSLVERTGPDSDTPLNQPELHAVFVTLTEATGDPARPPRWRWLELATGTAAAGCVLSLLGPWRELAVPQHLLGDLPLVFPGTVLSSLPGAGPLAWLVLAGAVATVAALVVPRARVAAGPLAAGTAALTVAGWLTVVPHLPPTDPAGTGYRIAPAGWLALTAAVLLGLCGLLVTALRDRPARRVVAAALVAVAGSVTAVLATSTPSYGDPQAGTVFEVGPNDLVTDAAGLRVRVADAFDRIAGSDALPFAATLDGAPGHWFLGNLPAYRRTEEVRTATVFGWRNGVASPLTTLRYSQVQLIGVTGDRMLALAVGRPNTRAPEPWAVVSVPLSAPYADISLTSGDSGGRPWVSSDVTLLLHGTADEVEAAPAGNGAIALTAFDQENRSADSLLVPADVVRAGNPWRADTLRAPTEAGALRIRTAPDGAVAWVRERQVIVAGPGGRPRALTATTADCRRQSVAGGTELAYDSTGNLWIASFDGLDVITTDGMRRTAPQLAGVVADVAAGPDGALLVSTADGSRYSGTKRVVRVPDAARVANSYPLSTLRRSPSRAADPPQRCDRATAPPATTAFTATRLGAVPVVDPPRQAGERGSGRAWDAELVLSGGAVRWMRPASKATTPVPDGQGGVWWTVPPPRGDDYLYTGTVSGVHVRADGTVTSTGLQVGLKQENGLGRSAASGDRFAYTSVAVAGDNRAKNGYLDFSGRSVRRLPLSGEIGLATYPSRTMAWSATGRAPELVAPIGTALVRINPGGSVTTLFGGRPDDEQVPISDAIARGLGKDHYSVKAQWFTGPDKAVWGYDGWYLYRVDPAGKVTVLGGQEQGVPPAANHVTVIGPALYFEVGSEIVKVTPKGAAR